MKGRSSIHKKAIMSMLYHRTNQILDFSVSSTLHENSIEAVVASVRSGSVAATQVALQMLR
jgi:hypothetical protein